MTIGFLYLEEISLRDATVYIIAQLAGGLSGVAILYVALFHGLGWEDAIAVGATRPGEGYALGVVFLAAVAGLVVMTEVWLEAPISGTSLNEARSLAPDYSAQTVYNGE